MSAIRRVAKLLGSEGSTVDYIGFKVKDLKATKWRWAQSLCWSDGHSGVCLSPRWSVQFLKTDLAPLSLTKF